MVLTGTQMAKERETRVAQKTPRHAFRLDDSLIPSLWLYIHVVLGRVSLAKAARLSTNKQARILTANLNSVCAGSIWTPLPSSSAKPVLDADRYLYITSFKYKLLALLTNLYSLVDCFAYKM